MEWLDVLRWVLALPLLALWLASAVGNGVSVARRALRGGGLVLLPLVGGLAGVAGFLLVPLRGWGAWAWVPPLADVGCVPALVAAWVATSRRSGAGAVAEDTDG